MSIPGSVRSILLAALAVCAVSCGGDERPARAEALPAPEPTVERARAPQPIAPFFAEFSKNRLAQVRARLGDLSPLGENADKVATLHFLHTLFTAKGAEDNSVGDVLRVPYFWHWVEPNPRHSIVLVDSGKTLKEIRPPKSHAKYASLADIDRTPAVFLADLVSPKEKYANAVLPSFSTFGWCSEREMAFVALVTAMGFDAKVATSGNHSWSEVLLPSRSDAVQHAFVSVRVDNTFDLFDLVGVDDSAAWRTNVGGTRSAAWYDRKAHDAGELAEVAKIEVTPEAAARLEEAVDAHFAKNPASRR